MIGLLISFFTNLKKNQFNFPEIFISICRNFYFYFIFSGDGSDEEMAAKTMNFPFWRVSSHTDLAALNNALDMQFI